MMAIRKKIILKKIKQTIKAVSKNPKLKKIKKLGVFMNLKILLKNSSVSIKKTFYRRFFH